MYRLELKNAARRALSKFSHDTRMQLRAALEDIEQNPTVLNPKVSGLVGPLAGLYRYRTGAYRIVYSIGDSPEGTPPLIQILVVAIAHRRDVYRD